MKTKEFILANIFIIVSLFIYNYFPASGIFQEVITILVFFAILPVLFNKFILKKHFDFISIWSGDYKQGILWSVCSLFAVGIIFFIISYFFDFFNYYTVPIFITDNFGKFLFYEFIVVVPFVALYEFYFRGFVMAVFKEKIGYWSVLVQALIFLILVLSTERGNMVQFYPYLIFAPFAGVITLKSRSIIYSGITQFIILFTLSVVVIRNIS